MSHAPFTESFEQILNDTVPQTPGVIRSVALRELRLACREFFERSYAWTDIITDVAITAGATEVTAIHPNANADVVGILSVSFNGRDLPPTAHQPTVLGQTPDFSPSNAPRSFYITSDPDEFSLFPFLKDDNANLGTPVCDIRVALIPSFTATDLPRQITLKYYDAIVNGYLSRMYGHPNKPYSSPILAGALRANFLRQIGFYMAQRKTGYAGAQQWRYPQEFNVRRLGGNG